MKVLIYDLLNGFTVHDFYLFFLQLFAALFIGQWLKIIVKRVYKKQAVSGLLFTLVPLLVALLVILSRNSAPLSISAVGIFVLVGQLSKKEAGYFDKLLVFLLAAAGFGCGSGFVLVTLLTYVFIVSPVLYFSAKNVLNDQG